MDACGKIYFVREKGKGQTDFILVTSDNFMGTHVRLQYVISNIRIIVTKVYFEHLIEECILEYTELGTKLYGSR